MQVKDVNFQGTKGSRDMMPLTNVNAAVIIDNSQREIEFMVIAWSLK